MRTFYAILWPVILLNSSLSFLGCKSDRTQPRPTPSIQKEEQHTLLQPPDLSKVRLKSLFEAIVAVVPAVKPTKEGGVPEVDELASGIVVDEKGFIVSTAHAAGRASEFEIILFGGKRVRAKSVALQPESGLALLHADTSGLRALSLARFGRASRGTVGGRHGLLR